MCWQIRGGIEWRCADFAERVGEKMKNCDFIQKNACILFFAVIVYKPNAQIVCLFACSKLQILMNLRKEDFQ